MTPTNTADLSALIEQLDALDAKRTKGPWTTQRDWPTNVVHADDKNKGAGGSIYEEEDKRSFAVRILKAEHDDYSKFAHEIPKAQAEANAAFIVALENLWPKLRAHLAAGSSVVCGPCKRKGVTVCFDDDCGFAKQPAPVPDVAKGSYYAKDGFVWKRPVEKKVSGGTQITIGFPVCKMHDAVGDDAAETVAQLMNLGEALSSSPPAPAPTVWREIETAPKDGTRLLLWHSWHNGYPVTGSWRNYLGPDKYDWRTDSGALIDPTAWQHLPESPPFLSNGERR